jgi:UDP-N-acetylglucosamine 2-epimerase (non-hydrolysing)
MSAVGHDNRPLIVCVVGARPNYMKMAPILRALNGPGSGVRTLLVHTGQHYDVEMNRQLFDDLGMIAPDINLEVGSGSHASQTAEVLRRFEPVVVQHAPRYVLVVGDVNSTLGCALVAAKLNTPVIHVEAGLRSGDRSMPEEINRILTDQLSDLLFTTEPGAAENLRREGIPEEKIHFVGNVMIDALLQNRDRAPPARRVLERLNLDPSMLGFGVQRYGVVTLHRPSNVDQPESLLECIDALVMASEFFPLLCVLHPRTRANLEKFALAERLASARIALLPPLGYLEMLGLLSGATVVLTDSGGVQEETTALGVPCLTMRENTERPITITEGTNRLVGRDIALIRESLRDLGTKNGSAPIRRPEGWDGDAAKRIAEIIRHTLA